LCACTQFDNWNAIPFIRVATPRQPQRVERIRYLYLERVEAVVFFVNSVVVAAHFILFALPFITAVQIGRHKVKRRHVVRPTLAHCMDAQFVVEVVTNLAYSLVECGHRSGTVLHVLAHLFMIFQLRTEARARAGDDAGIDRC